jgi:hypothetical protein
MRRFWMYCLNAKSSEERVVYKRLNSTGTLIRQFGNWVEKIAFPTAWRLSDCLPSIAR